MAVHNLGDIWSLRGRGFKDSLRHDKRVKDAIRKNLQELIAEEAIITSDGNKRVKIPVRYLDQYRFKYGNPQDGVGHGAGNVGDILGQRRKGDMSGSGPPGEEAGELVYEVEMPLDELTRMMLEDLALPWLEEKTAKQVTITTPRYTDRRRKGPMSRLAIRPTMLENLKRHAAAGEPIRVGNWRKSDLRYKVWDEHEEKHANAAVYMLMDRSGSMTTEKKYIAKSFFFWMVRFLRLKYHHVETVFIAHDTVANVVPEKDFFALSNSGGTLCSSAYEVALAEILEHHPETQWNTYLFHFSDGDNLPYDNEKCKEFVAELLDHCTMVGYGEISYEDETAFYRWGGQTRNKSSTLQDALRKIDSPRLLNRAITRKEQLYEVLQAFLQPQEKNLIRL